MRTWDRESGSVAFATMAYFIGSVAVLFTYTFFWDLYVGFWNIGLAYGADPTAYGYFYTIHEYLPVIFFITWTIAYVAYIEFRRVP
jgi:hypothetical protein